MTQWAESRAQKMKLRSIENHSQEAILGPTQKRGNMCPAEFQNC